MPNSSPFVKLAILALALVVVALVGIAIAVFVDRRSAGRFALAAFAWLSLSAVLALGGFLSDFDARPPRLPLLIVPTLALPLILAYSRTGVELAARVPLALLVGFHGFRLPLELVMHRAAIEGTMPWQMTYGGSNFDIITGTSALLVAGLAATGRAPHWLLVAWNALGTGLLVAIIGVAVASLPALHAFGSAPERLNTWIAYFPFVWLPAALVSAALLGHLLLWRRLLSRGMRGRALSAFS